MNINEILTDVGLKCTKQRINVLKILLEASEPLTAENIYEQAEEMSLSTVYRIAEKFCEKGIVSRNTIIDSDKFYYELVTAKHRHYAICLGCRQMRYINICPVHSADIDNFTVTGHKLEIYGYCDKCKNK